MRPSATATEAVQAIILLHIMTKSINDIRILHPLATSVGKPTTHEQVVTEHGYWPICLGAFPEGENILVGGVYFAHSGYLVLP